MLKEEGGFLQHTWRLITVFIILISFRISFPIGNLELKTSVCDSLLWCWDLFQQPAAALVAQGRGGLAVAGVCALDLVFFCPASTMGVALHLQYLNTTALVVLRTCYLQPCSLHFTPSSATSPHSCCGSRFHSFWSEAFPLLGSCFVVFHALFIVFVPANPDMVIMYFHRRQLPLAWVCHLISPFFLSLIL